MIEEFKNLLTNLIKSIKTLFSLYVIIYLVPTFTVVYLLDYLKDKLFTSVAHDINCPIYYLFISLIIKLFLWSIFYLIYFTSQRTKNPHLYEKGFLKDFNVKEK